MGKAKRTRTRQKCGSQPKEAVLVQPRNSIIKPAILGSIEGSEVLGPRLQSLFPSANLFKSAAVSRCDVSPDSTSKILSGNVQPAVIKSASEKLAQGKKLTKKEKRKLKHENWLQKIDSIKEKAKKSKEERRRQAVPSLGDTQTLMNALPNLEHLLQNNVSRAFTRKEREEKQARRSTLKFRELQKLAKRESQIFRAVLDDPAYKQNPGVAMNEHLRNKVRSNPSMVSAAATADLDKRVTTGAAASALSGKQQPGAGRSRASLKRKKQKRLHKGLLKGKPQQERQRQHMLKRANNAMDVA